LGSLGGFVTLHDVGDESDLPAVVWLTLAMTSFLMFPYLMNSLFMPFERLNIFLLSMAKMMRRDLFVFLLLFGFFMFDFYIALFFLYPRAGTLSMPQVRDFNTWYSALQALFLLAFTGSPSHIDIEVDFTTLSNMQAFDFTLWLVVYLMFTILSLILLLNLLIAMLSFTFESVRDESTLQCRTSFAQGIIRLELLADSFGMAYQVGEEQGTDRVYTFRTVEGKSQGSSGGGDGGDPFAVSTGTALERIESKLGSLEKVEEQLAKVQAQLNRMEPSGGRVITELLAD